MRYYIETSQLTYNVGTRRKLRLKHVGDLSKGWLKRKPGSDQDLNSDLCDSKDILLVTPQTPKKSSWDILFSPLPDLSPGGAKVDRTDFP